MVEYKKGDKVRYNATVRDDVECEHCGHTETEYKKVKRTGTVVGISSTTNYYSFADITITDTEERPPSVTLRMDNGDSCNAKDVIKKY